MRVEYEALGQNDVVVATSGMTLSRVQGYFNGASNRWLQLHDAKATPADTAVPLRVWPLYADAPFDQNFQNDPIALANGCVFVVSSTRATLTISADTMDIYVNGMQTQDTIGVSVGDYTTDVELLEVWADGSPKALLRLEVSDLNNVGPMYVQIHAKSPSAGEVPLKTWLVPVSASLDKTFGGGFAPFRTNTDETTDNGCFIAISSTLNTYTAWGSNDFQIKATYK